MNIREALEIVKISLENTAIATVKSLKGHNFRVDIGDKHFKVVNLPKVQQVQGKVAVTNQQDLEKQLRSVNQWLGVVAKRLEELKAHKSVSVENFPPRSFR